MSDAAARLCATQKTADARVSIDGTWQRKLVSSTLGVVTAISIKSGKVQLFCTLIMIKKLPWILWNCLRLIQVIICQNLLDLSVFVVNIHPFIGCRNHREKRRRCCVITKESSKTRTLKLKEPCIKRGTFKTQYQVTGFVICCFICIVNDILCQYF